jgi:hypothetical protein
MDFTDYRIKCEFCDDTFNNGNTSDTMINYQWHLLTQHAEDVIETDKNYQEILSYDYEKANRVYGKIPYYAEHGLKSQYTTGEFWDRKRGRRRNIPDDEYASEKRR